MSLEVESLPPVVNNQENNNEAVVDHSTDSNESSSIEADPVSSSSSDTTPAAVLAKNENTAEENANNYDTVFPSLSTTGAHLTVSDAWNKAKVQRPAQNRRGVSRAHTTQVFQVPIEERRQKDISFGNEQNKRCEEIARRMGVKVEICQAKDQSLHIVISGGESAVIETKAKIFGELQAEREQKIRVPREQHKYLIGKAGSVLKELQEKSCTRIQVPKSESGLDLVTITGPKDGIEQAIQDIQLIVDESSKSAMDRITIPKNFHPWLRGFNNEVSQEIMSRLQVKINLPPPQVEKNEITVSGEIENVAKACKELQEIYERKNAKSKMTKLALQIIKSQHKLIIGKNGSNVHDIFKDYDVYVQVPKSDSTSETIYLYGDESQVGAALTQVCAYANSVVNVSIDVPSWLHRHMIGEKGANISRITADFPNTHVKFEQDDRITVDGPPDEVEKVKECLENITIGLKQIMICEEVTCEPRFHGQLIGKKYENLSRLNKEYGVTLRMPEEKSGSSTVKIEGPPDAVKKAKVEFLELVKRLENERSKDIIIEQRHHSTLIGKNGKNLNEIRTKFGDLSINIPAVAEKSDVVTIRGPKEDVEKCFTHLKKLIKEMNESGYQEEIQIFKEFHRVIIGKQGSFIKKIRDEIGVRVDVPSESSDSNVVTLTGKQENVIKARAIFDAKVKELVNIKEDFVEIPHSLHTALIGKGGIIIKQIRKDCGGVIINFPSAEDSDSDKIQLRGPLDEIAKAKIELLKLAEHKNDISYSEEIYAKAEFHRYLVGHKGTNINAWRDKYNVRIIFPQNNNNSSEVPNNNKTTDESSQKDAKNPADMITIIGKKENVQNVREDLESFIKNLEEQTTDELHVDQKWHKKFIARRARLVNKISEENCNVKISFPKAANTESQTIDGDNNSNSNNSNNTRVTIKGVKEAVAQAKKRIEELVYEFENQVSVEVHVPQKFHVSVIGKQGVNSQQISDQCKVDLQFPAKSERGDNNNNQTSETNDVITVTGLAEDCEKAKEAIIALVPVTENIPFPKRFHKDLVANKAELLAKLSNEHNIQVQVPKRDELDAEYVTVIGTREAIDGSGREALSALADDLELKNYTVEIVDIKADLIPQLRGRNGVEAQKLEKKFSVKVDFSKKGEPDKVAIRGLKDKVESCEAHIREKIALDEAKVEDEINVDNRVHSRIIGFGGKALAKITEKFKVDVRFTGRTSDVVMVRGDSQDAVDDAIDHIKNLEEEYLQDVTEKDAYTHPSRQHHGNQNGGDKGQSQKGFEVKGAPWNMPDTSNMDLFPSIASTAGTAAAGASSGWGPQKK